MQQQKKPLVVTPKRVHFLAALWNIVESRAGSIQTAVESKKSVTECMGKSTRFYGETRLIVSHLPI